MPSELQKTVSIKCQFESSPVPWCWSQQTLLPEHKIQNSSVMCLQLDFHIVIDYSLACEILCSSFLVIAMRTSFFFFFYTGKICSNWRELMHTFPLYYIGHQNQYFLDCYKQLQETHASTFPALSNRCSHALTRVHCKYVCTQEAHIAQIYRPQNQLACPSTFAVLCCIVASLVFLKSWACIALLH